MNVQCTDCRQDSPCSDEIGESAVKEVVLSALSARITICPSLPSVSEVRTWGKIK